MDDSVKVAKITRQQKRGVSIWGGANPVMWTHVVICDVNGVLTQFQLAFEREKESYID